MKPQRPFYDPAPMNVWGASAEEYARLSEDISFYPAIARHLVALTPPAARVVMDFGCGHGRYTRLLLDDVAHGSRARPRTVYLVDIAAEMLALTEDLDSSDVAMVRMMDDETLGRMAADAQGSVDVVACSSSFHLCNDVDAFMARCGSRLGPEGCIIANIPDQDFAFGDGRPSAFLQMSDHVFGGYTGPRPVHFDEQRLRDLADRHGYRCTIDVQSFAVRWDDFVRFYSIPFIGARRMPQIPSAPARAAWLAALPPAFDTIEYRWAFATFVKTG